MISNDKTKETTAMDERIGLDRRAFLALLAGGPALSGGLALPGSALAQGAPRKGGILRVSAPTNPSSLDPATGGSGSDHVFLYTIYDTLVAFDYETLKPIPGLAESWSYPDPNHLVLNLRPGVLFHDGTQCDAAAVKFNLDRNRGNERSNVRPDLETVTDVTISGPNQVTLTLSQPDTALPLILADRAGMMCSPKAVQERGKDHDRNPVGAGPWKFVSWADSEKITVTRHEQYWRPGRPYLDGVELSIITEVNTGLRSVIAGQNDFIYFLSPQQKPVIDRTKSLTAIAGPTLYCVQLYLNWGRPPFNDLRVRQAMNYAVNREEFNKATMNGLSEPAVLVLPAAHWAHDKEMAKSYPYDPAKARQLLADAGYKDGIDIAMIGYTDQRSQQRQEVLIEQYGKAGIRLHFTNGTVAEMSAAFLSDKKGDAFLSAWTGRPDPSLTYQLLFGAGAYYNASRIEAVPEIGPALRATRAAEDIESRRKAFAVLQRLVTENALVVPLLFQFELDAHNARVKGYRPNLLGKPKFEDVYLEG
jgi:ABC-type transport system substrate-binding protein